MLVQGRSRSTSTKGELTNSDNRIRDSGRTARQDRKGSSPAQHTDISTNTRDAKKSVRNSRTTTETTAGTPDTKSKPKRDETQPRTAKSHCTNHGWTGETESERALS
jgi:hypothetical protein